MAERVRAQQELQAWCRRHRQHLFALEEETAEWLLAMVSRAVEGDELRPHREHRDRRDMTAKISFAEHVLLHFTREIVKICLDDNGAPQYGEDGLMQFEKTGWKPPWLQAILELDLDRPH